MTIHIEALTFEAILGILPHERTAPQPIRIDCRIDYPYDGEQFLDYAAVVALLREETIRGRFRLVEETLEHLLSSLKASFPLITSVRLKICKPAILPDCRVCVEERRDFL